MDEEVDIELNESSVLSDEGYQNQHTLINMNEVFMLNVEIFHSDDPADTHGSRCSLIASAL